MAIRGAIRYEPITVSTTAVGLTTTPADGVLPEAAVITVEGAAIRFCVDGTTATATVGHAREPGEGIELAGRGELAQFSAIRRDGVDATLRVTMGTEYVP